MKEERDQLEIIGDMIAERESHTDTEILEELASIPPLEDEENTCWGDFEYYMEVGFPYFALAEIAAQRRLTPAIRLLLDRACYGDPGESMRGLRHYLERIVNPKWSELADICLEAAQSPRLGTKLWAIDELVILEDPRAKTIFEEALKNDIDEIRRQGERGLWRLANPLGYA